MAEIIEKELNTSDIIHMIKVFMSLREDEYYLNWISNDILYRFKFKGDQYEVMEAVLEWLTSPPRLQNIKTMSKIRDQEKELSDRSS